MKILITGASSGIGRDMAIEFANQGHELVLVARRNERLQDLAAQLNVPTKIISLDLSKPENCYQLYAETKDDNIDVLVNNAGFGVFGDFANTSLDDECEMVDLNMKSLHILMKLFLVDMKKRDFGYILNVASFAAFTAGPKMASYFASKAYVLRLSEAVSLELKAEKSNVSISILCPGVVKTEFGKRAGTGFSKDGANSEFVAKYAIQNMWKRKLIIIPTFQMKVAKFLVNILPNKVIDRIVLMLTTLFTKPN